MDLVILVLGLALVGCFVWFVITYIPMPDVFKIAIQIIAAVAVLLYLVQRFRGSVPNLLR